MNNESEWHKPTEKERLDAANKQLGLNKKKGKNIDWWDRVKTSIIEDTYTKDADFEIVEQKRLPNSLS